MLPGPGALESAMENKHFIQEDEKWLDDPGYFNPYTPAELEIICKNDQPAEKPRGWIAHLRLSIEEVPA